MEDLKSNPSIYGYFNWQEAQSVVLAVIGADAFTQLFLDIAVGVLRNSDKIYVGPNATVITQVCGTLAAILAGYYTRKRLVIQGR